MTERQKRVWNELEGRISAAFAGDVLFDGVVFDNCHKHGILLADMAMLKRWKHVYFGEGNRAASGGIFAPLPEHLHVPPRPMGGGLPWQYPENAPRPRITPVGGVHKTGEKLRVTIAAAGGCEIRYTLDGSIPRADSPRYTAPMTVARSTTVKARCFRGGRRLGPAARTRYEFAPVLSPSRVTRTKAGLAYAYYPAPEGESWDFALPDLANLSPKRSGVAREFSSDVGRRDDEQLDRHHDYAVVFTGYLNVAKEGLFTFRVLSVYDSELRIGDTVVATDPKPAGGARTHIAQGRVFMKPGEYSLRLASNQDRWRKLAVEWQPPGENMQPIPAEALSH
jgi:hypothetical protein